MFNLASKLNILGLYVSQALSFQPSRTKCNRTVNVSMGVMGQPEAVKVCSDLRGETTDMFYMPIFLPEPQTKDEATIISRWLVSKGVPQDSTAGYWTGYKRFKIPTSQISFGENYTYHL